jgi:regulator-associated protein of mTOR
MLHALTSFIGIPDLTPQVAQIEASIASMVLIMASDGNTMVRKELLVFFSTFIARYQSRFLVAAYEQLKEEQSKSAAGPTAENKEDTNDAALLPKINGRPDSAEDAEGDFSSNTIFAIVWREVLIMSVDPHPEIAENACIVVDYVLDALLHSPLGQHAHPLMDTILHHKKPPASSRYSYVEVPLPTNNRSRPTTPPTPTKAEGYLTASLKRTASVAASLKSLAFGNTPSSHDSSPRSTTRSPLAGTPANRPRMNGELNRPPDEKDHYHIPSAYPSLKAPLPRGYKSSHGPGMEKPSMPLRSKFFEWSVEYFREPQMKPPEADEPGSIDYNQRLWRRNRNDRIIAKTQPQKEMAGTSPWDKPKGFWNNGTQPVKLCWHQFEDQLIVTDDRDGVA